MAEYERIEKIIDAQEDSVFLWVARQVGKSIDRHPRLLNGIEVLPATEFLRKMWQGEIF